MKKFLQTTTFVAAILFAFNANAAAKLSISTAMPTAMKIIIDGQKFYSQDNKISINNLQAGYHSITVYYIKNGRDFNSFFNNGNNGYWKKAVSKQVSVRNNYVYDITINRFGRAFFDQDYCNANSNHWDNDDMQDGNDDYGFDYNNGYNEDYDDWGYFKRGEGKNHLPNTQNNQQNLGSAVISNSLFEQIKQTIQEQPFESSKLSVAKQSINKKNISTTQAKDLLDLLSMETSKLDFAKFAYDKVVDKDKYFTISNNLSMQSSKDELLKFLRPKND